MSKSKNRNSNPSIQMPAGPNSDAQGRTTLDPTLNVKGILHASERRQDDLRRSEFRGIRREMYLHQYYGKQLSKKESKRIDAIRQVDVGAVASSAAVQASQQGALAGTVTATAEAARVALRSETDPLRKDIAELRQVQYETAGGKQQVTETREKSSNWGLWLGLAVAAFVGFNGLMLTLTGIIVTLVLTKR